jgi:methylated-DNA-protein-cysteine methyltransferase related protein
MQPRRPDATGTTRPADARFLASRTPSLLTRPIDGVRWLTRGARAASRRRRPGWQAGGVDEETVERVRAAVRAIPPGETASYGEIAERTGLRSARLVGRILAEDGHDLPWHRVLRADGTCAPHLVQEQSARLRAEGILMEDGRLPRTHRAR